MCQHILASQIHPYLPIELWEHILKRTDPITCLVFCRPELAFEFGESSALLPYSVVASGFLAGTQLLCQSGRAEIGDVKLFETACKHGHLHIVRWMHENGFGGCTTTAGDIDDSFLRHDYEFRLIPWLHENRSESYKEAAMDLAAENGHLHVVRWLHDNRSDGCTSVAMDLAARNGHLDVVRFLQVNRLEGYMAMHFAAVNGHLEIVRFLHENQSEGCEEETIMLAAKNGHLDVVRFLYNNGLDYGFGIYAMNNAVAYGHLEIVRFLHDKCKRLIDDWAIKWACHCGHLDIIRFIFDNRREMFEAYEPISPAIINGQLDVVRFLHENGLGDFKEYTNDHLMLIAVQEGRLDIIRFLHENGWGEAELFP